MKSLSCIPILCLAFSWLAFSDTINVPEDYPTIQQGIDAAVNGDTVLVAPGTYRENINFKGKAITVTSSQGAGITVIDGNQALSVVSALSKEGPDSVLDGFTVTNGYAVLDGGGIWCISSSPTLMNNIISDNYAPVFGGGIFCSNSSAEINNNIITNNSAGYYGGGICQHVADLKIFNNIITHNGAKQGGGLWIDKDCSPWIVNNLVAFNEATHASGGGIGIQQWDQLPPMFPKIINNTIAKNMLLDPMGKGSGIYCAGLTEVTVINTVLWQNYAQNGKEIYIESFMENSSELTITYSNVDGGMSSVYHESGCILNWGPGMIDIDPLFLDPDHDDFHLTFASPCIDIGDNTAPSLPEFDLDKEPRIIPHGYRMHLGLPSAVGIVDMGADEYGTWIQHKFD